MLIKAALRITSRPGAAALQPGVLVRHKSSTAGGSSNPSSPASKLKQSSKMPHKGKWADETVRKGQQMWDDRSPDSFRPFAHPEQYEQRARRPPSPPAGSFQDKPVAGSSKQRYIPPAARKAFEARHAVERGFEGYLHQEYPQRQAVDSWRPASPPRTEGRKSRGYSPSQPADGQYEAAASEGSRRDRSAQYSGGSVPTEERRYLSRDSEEPSGSQRTRGNTPQPKFQPFLPAPEYVALSRKPAQSDPPTISPKLLVLDLNGTLVYRSSSNTPPHPRPYLSSFLQYLFLPEPKDAHGRIPPRPWEAFVWSSAQPHNVRKMVTGAFGERWIRGLYDAEDGVQTVDEREAGEGRLLGVWARDKMNLSSTDYSRKVQTVKDLRILLDHLSEERSRSVEDRPQFDESNTVLLDDSPLKAVHQPWSQLIIPEYDHGEYQISKAIAKTANDHPSASENGLDVILLAVIGILEELRTVDSVPTWIRTEGLMSFGDSGPPCVSKIDVADEPTLETLPSHDSFLHWHKNMAIAEHWRRKGLEALERKGISAEIGVLKDDLRSSRSATPQRERRGKTPQREVLSPHGSIIPLSPLPNPRRQASPSRPREQEQGGRRHLHTTDSWRTFRASDVALYLQDVADRPSSLTSLQRQTLYDTIHTLSSLGPTPEWEDQALARLRGGPWDRDICEDCLLTAAERENKRLNAEAIKEQRIGLKKGRTLMRIGGKIEKKEREEAAKAKKRKEKRSAINVERVAAEDADQPLDNNRSRIEDAHMQPEEKLQPAAQTTIQIAPAEVATSEIQAGHQTIENDILTSLRERAVCKVLLETIRLRGGRFLLNGSREGHCVVRNQLNAAHTRITKLQNKLGALGRSSPFEITDMVTIGPADMRYLSEATLNKSHRRCLKQLDITPGDFLAGRSLPEGTAVVGLDPPKTPRKPKRARSNTATSTTTVTPERKSARLERWASKRLAELQITQQGAAKASEGGPGEPVESAEAVAVDN